MLDTLYRGATVVDGTGAPARRADVGVRDGRIVAVGDVDEAAATVHELDGLHVAPGFIDLHTHYDCQLFWDPLAQPSSLFGFTTVFGGNCGFTVAPVRAGDDDYLRRLMARVEGMPLEALEHGLAWDWTSFGSWLDRLEGNLGVNAGFHVGHSAVRRLVMGAGSDGPASPEQLDAMRALVDEAIAAGALGFSSSQSQTHLDGDGRPVPSMAASREEMLALAEVSGRHEGTNLEVIITGCLNGFSDADVDLLVEMSAVARRPLNWNVLTAGPRSHERQLEPGTLAPARGGQVVALTMPTTSGNMFSFLTHNALFTIPGWGEVVELPVPQRIAELRKPEVRARLRELAAAPEAGLIGNLVKAFGMMEFGDTGAPGTEDFAERNIGALAAERGMDPFDFALDVLCDNELKTGLWLIPGRTDDPEVWRARAELWQDPRVIVGGSDAGAHLDRMCEGHYSSSLLGEAARDRQALTVEAAVNLLTDRPARLYGLRGRGRVAAGFQADLVVFDLAALGASRLRRVQDLPGGAERLHRDPIGVHRVVVNGADIVVDGAPTGALPGTLLRSGRDTETPALPAA